MAPARPVDTFKDYLDWMHEGDAQRRRIAVSSNTTFVEVLNVLLRRSIGEQLEPVHLSRRHRLLGELRDGASPRPSTPDLAAAAASRPALPHPDDHRHAAAVGRRPTSRPRAELGYPSLDMEEWFAFFGPPGTPAEMVAQLNRRLRR